MATERQPDHAVTRCGNCGAIGPSALYHDCPTHPGEHFLCAYCFEWERREKKD